ncbi:MAG TPA: glycosyltransferase family 39 protein [Dehalococcoidia bacterium]
MTIAQIRRHAPALGLILIAAFVLRLIWVLCIHPDPTAGWEHGDVALRRLDDTVWYRGTAHWLSLGKGYLNPFAGTPTAAWPPGYPFFLGAIFKLFGEGITQTYAANIVLSLLTVIVVYGIGLAIFDQRTALVGAAAVAVWPGQIYFTSLTLSEPLFTLLFTLSVLLIVLVPKAGRARGVLLIALGLLAGAATLTRGQALLLLPIAVAYWALLGFRWRPSIAWGILAAFVVAVVLAPWVARNQRELGGPVIIATNFGPNVWLGHHEGATGRMAAWVAEPPQPERGNLTQGEYEVEADRLALKKGLSYMLSNPAKEVRLSAIKIRAIYEADSTALDWNSAYTPGYYASGNTELALRRIANGFWFAALGLAGIGLLASRARLSGPIALLPMILLVWTVTHLLFFGEPRFHYPIVFIFALLGARGLVVLYEALRRPQPSLDESGRYAAA